MALPNQRTTETMSESDLQTQLGELLQRVSQDEDRIIIEKDGVPVAAIVPLSVVRDAESTERRRQDLREAFEATREEMRGIPPDEIEREIAQAVADVDESRRQRDSSHRSTPET